MTAIEKRDVQHKVVLEVMDHEGVLGVVHSLPIAIRGEAYKIETLVKFPQVCPHVLCLHMCVRSFGYLLC